MFCYFFTEIEMGTPMNMIPFLCTYMSEIIYCSSALGSNLGMRHRWRTRVHQLLHVRHHVILVLGLLRPNWLELAINLLRRFDGQLLFFGLNRLFLLPGVYILQAVKL